MEIVHMAQRELTSWFFGTRGKRLMYGTGREMSNFIPSENSITNFITFENLKTEFIHTKSTWTKFWI
jgi:hypothetical protein